jgi:quercetin dioxygenase-like cupin family protein
LISTFNEHIPRPESPPTYTGNLNSNARAKTIRRWYRSHFGIGQLTSRELSHGLSQGTHHHFDNSHEFGLVIGFSSTDDFHEEVDTKVSSIPLSDCFGSTIRAKLEVREDVLIALESSLPRGAIMSEVIFEHATIRQGKETKDEAPKGAARPHQHGESAFKSTLPEEIDWKPFPAFPPSVRLAVVVGTPSERGPYTIRVRVPRGVKLMPHRHPEDRVYTVISGVFYIGLGDRFDADKLEAYPPGAVIVLPGDTSHFHWAKSSEYITQITAIGPLGIDYLTPKDDPRNKTA